MVLASHAAIVRGDDYHFYFGWLCVSRALKDPDVVSISVEDPDSGSFDDVVVRRSNGRSEYFQLKSSNSAGSIIDDDWLMTKSSPTARSTLQKLFATWSDLHRTAPGTFAIVTNKGLDPNHPLLQLKDNQSDTIGPALRKATPMSKPGKALGEWADHVGVTREDLLDFLDAVQWRSEGGERAVFERCVDAMRAAGLRSDGDAVRLGVDVVRRWVKEGSGPQSADEIRRAVASGGLLASTGRLVFAVHALDRRPAPSTEVPNVECDWASLYEGTDTRTRRPLPPVEWEQRIKPGLADATRVLESYGVGHVHVTGSLRLPMWFAVGHYLPEVRRWTLSCDQRGSEWSTTTYSPTDPAIVSNCREVGSGTDLAVGISLTHDLQSDLTAYIDEAGLSVHSLLNLTVPDGAGVESIKSGAHANSWARAARQEIYAQASKLRPAKVLLFMAAPAGVALMLGHHWNMLPRTTVYEHLLYADYVAGPTLS